MSERAWCDAESGGRGDALDAMMRTRAASKRTVAAGKASVLAVAAQRAANLGPGPYERRQMTVMFIDVADSTALSERIDPETFFAIMQGYGAICKACVQRYGGNLAQSFGDGLLFYFGVPQAHEDDAERAVQAGFAILEAMAAETFETRDLGPVRLTVRIAVNTGQVVIGPLEGIGTGVFGTSTVVAARLQNFAPPNAIVIGATTHELVRGTFRCESLGRIHLKGIEGTTETWQVLASLNPESRFARKHTLPLSPMYGRTDQLAHLNALWRETLTGHGQVAAISGEPGIGKSRLVLEFRNSLKGTEHGILFFQCSPLYCNTPVAPIIEQVRRDARISSADQPSQALAKLKALFDGSMGSSQTVLPYYGAILSIPPCDGYEPADLSLPGARERMLQVIADVPAAMARDRPILIVIEDAQWIDPTSRRLTALLLSRISSERVMYVITHRDTPPVDITGGTNITDIALSRLSPDACAQLIENIAGGARLPRFLLDRIVKRTDGIPLVIEEVTRTVLNSGALERVGNDLKVRKSLPEPLLPATLQDSLRERLDSLGPAKLVAQVASVLGREFTFKALQEISGLSRPALMRALDNLAAAGLIRERSAVDSRRYLFNHAMIQEEAYASLLQDTRRQLHQRAAAWLTKEIAGRDSEQVAVLAYHYARAELPEKATAYWLEAGQAAMRRSAALEAIAHLNEGLLALKRWPKPAETFAIEIELQLHMAMSYIGLEGWSGRHTDAAYRRALELSRRHGNLRQKSMALWGVSRSLMLTDLEASLKLAQEYLALGEAAGDEEIALMAHTALTTSNFYLGHLTAARHSVEYVLSHYRFRDHRTMVNRYQHDPKIVALVFGGHIHWLLGEARKGRNCCRKARRLAQRIGHPFMLALTYVVGASDHLYNHELEAGWSSIEEGMRHAETHGLIAYRDFAPLWAIEAAMAHDSSEANLDKLAACLDRLLRYDVYLTVPFYQACLAVQMGRYRRHDKALELTNSALKIMRRTRETWFEPEIHRIRGVLLDAPQVKNSARAQTAFRRSLREARQRKMLGWELRTALTYADFLRLRGRQSEADKLLKQVTGKFAAGEISAELREARRQLTRRDDDGEQVATSASSARG
jgi:class 3 adenylate cyclase/DNA-binding MarR family transcriptional regulator